MKTLFITLLITSAYSLACNNNLSRCKNNPVQLVVLGIAQDAGYPQLNCYKPHCMPAWKDPKLKKLATSLGLIDVVNHKKYLFEATPDIRQQMYNFHTLADDEKYPLSGIFLTHAHMGHYTGLMHMGREAAGTNSTPVYVMPKMKQFLSNNGPWSQLVDLKNIVLKDLKNQQILQLSNNIKIEPLIVPHRDEFSEAVGFKIYGPSKTALFIPDIDKWKKWDKDIIKEIKQVDYALLDATFFENGEISNRDMSEIPHPFVSESMQLFSELSTNEKDKIIFIHFNHSNPLLQVNSNAKKQVLKRGFKIASEGLQLEL